MKPGWRYTILVIPDLPGRVPSLMLVRKQDSADERRQGGSWLEINDDFNARSFVGNRA